MFIITQFMLKSLVDSPENNYAKSPSYFSFNIFQEITKGIRRKIITKDNKEAGERQLS